jgi:hypothetical protein
MRAPQSLLPNLPGLAKTRARWVVPTRNAGAIADRLNALNHNRELPTNLSSSAQKTAAVRSWQTCRELRAETVKTAAWH